METLIFTPGYTLYRISIFNAQSRSLKKQLAIRACLGYNKFGLIFHEGNNLKEEGI